ncbi:energy transducer TonB [Sphingomonas sp. 1P06PA]|uniref:energy transducer TonB n=1 Tax=Sphingomonas sp. 1P06PA TaxID=554121 RepID=UPI0039A4B53E
MPPALAPGGPWVVDRSEGGCSLLRTFGSGADAVSVRIDRSPISSTMLFTLLAPAVDGRDSSERERAVRIEPGLRWRASDAPVERIADKREKFYLAIPSPKDLSTATRITFEIGDGREIAILPTGLPAGLRALDGCSWRQLQEWGIDPAQVGRIVQPAVEARPIVMDDRDFPNEALENGARGVVTVLWQILASGQVSWCRNVHLSGSTAFAPVPCRAIRARGRYQPARDASGSAVESYAIRRVAFWQPKLRR